MVVINAVERRCQVGVKDPQPLDIDALCGQEDSLDRVMTATARPKTIGLRLEPSFPLRFQCADRQGLQRPVSDDGNTERSPFSVALGYIHTPDRLRYP